MFKSTREGERFSIEDAILKGLADDGGLFVPEEFPSFTPEDFDGLTEYTDIALKFLEPFFKGSSLSDHLSEIVCNAFNFNIPLVDLGSVELLDLTMGPTNAFKDVGARFLARCLSNIRGEKTILVATSGDTGSAVASAFHNVANTRVLILFPKGKISEIQEKQLTCWDNNIVSFRVDGDFDDCQRIVKEIFMENEEFSSANSINIGRLLPQCTYYAVSSLQHFRKTGEKTDYIIPTGNMGNAMACIWAKVSGLPIGRIAMATNANRPIPEFFTTLEFTPRASIATLANAMDVGNPSNMERFLDLLKQQIIDLSELDSHSVLDSEIKKALRDFWEEYNRPICPHTATAYHVWKLLGWSKPVLVATADPAKFKEIVEQEIGQSIPVPHQLMELLQRPNTVVDIRADARAVLSRYREVLDQ